MASSSQTVGLPEDDHNHRACIPTCWASNHGYTIEIDNPNCKPWNDGFSLHQIWIHESKVLGFDNLNYLLRLRLLILDYSLINQVNITGIFKLGFHHRKSLWVCKYPNELWDHYHYPRSV